MIRRIGIILLLQTLVLLAMVALKQWTLSTGKEILLETQPIDPRSLFRGDYVRLGYGINRLRTPELDGDDRFDREQEIHVVLAKGENYWQAVSLHHERPSVPADRVVIRGRILNIQEGIWNGATKKQEAGRELRVDYGIENYFVPEGEGRALERPALGEKVDILVAVDRFGKAGIKGVLINGTLRYSERMF
ncbi:MAG: GDYXXLXY domain-containing protein [Gammaproteobacteria bacterium]|nr:GDYXXLXY domain-containing protein [Gammaproteobacteria bacterium]MBU1656175.1 GDYXXLXY domain-containing protein [Gammaproteobacteria bacterium]MBU1961308.1 GDYXXLXY domain-containing protein [Gammaproteobacteria bacterium]